MRSTAWFLTKAVATFGLLICVAGLAAGAACRQFDGTIHPLAPEEMAATVGLQTADYVCYPTGFGCCQGFQCGQCPDCFQCTDQTSTASVCNFQEGFTCTSLPSVTCGDLLQGQCRECCKEGGCESYCNMGTTIVVGLCGTLAQCQ